MLIGKVLEKTQAEQAWHICADKLADNVRDTWLNNNKLGLHQWESTFSEEPAALLGLGEEGFGDVVGIDYIFKWWGSTDTDEVAGEVTVVWKIANPEGGIICYRSWLRLTDMDFVVGLYKNEREKREANRSAFRDAFASWRELFLQLEA